MADINEVLGETPGPNISGDRIYITSQYLNLNGLLQSGRESYDLTLGTATANEIASLGNATGSVVLTNSDVLHSGFTVRYNTYTRQIEVDDVNTEGGYIDLTGRILNTGNGIIRAMGGYPEIDITNNTDYDLVVYNIDVSEPGTGTVIIKDMAKGTTDNPLVTIYQQTAGGTVTKTVDDGEGGDPTVVSTVDTTSEYVPKDGWRYGWSVGVETFDRYYYHHDKTAWIGIDWLAVDPASVEWDTHEVLEAPRILEDGPYFFDDPSITDAYTYDYSGLRS